MDAALLHLEDGNGLQRYAAQLRRMSQRRRSVVATELWTSRLPSATLRRIATGRKSLAGVLNAEWLVCEHMFASQLAWDEGLDEAQLAVATHGETPLVVVAGAGTGKTRALTSRVACLLDRGVAPDRILLLTFTRRAADDMLARARDLVGLRGAERPQGGTFHAAAHRHVSSFAEVLDLPTGFGVLDPAGACDLMDLLRSDHGIDGDVDQVPARVHPRRHLLPLHQYRAPSPRPRAVGVPMV